MNPIEILKNRLYKSIEINGIGAKETIELSQKLDKLIVVEMKVKIWRG